MALTCVADAWAQADSAGQQGPIHVEADRLTGDQEGHFHAQGSVRLDGQGIRAWGDDVYGSMQDNEIAGSGNTGIEREGDLVSGSRFFLDLENNTGYVDQPSYQLGKYRAHGRAQKLEFSGKDRLRATKATYTTCDLGRDDWYLKASQLDIDRRSDIGIARNVTLRFKDVPILFTPYIDFPVESRRKSGLLAPIFGTTQTGGVEYTQPIYFNLAPNYDDTLTPRFMSKRGLLLDNELRYLTRGAAGELHAEYLERDRKTDTKRYGLSFRHRHNLGAGFSFDTNLNKASDDRYFIDLSRKIAATSQTNLPREGALSYNAGWWGGSIRLQKFQTLQDPLAPVTPPYFRYPQIALNASRSDVAGFDLSFTGEAVKFEHPTLVSAWRELYYPSIQLPIETNYFTFTPKFGAQYRHYRFDGDGRKDRELLIPITNLDLSAPLERDAVLFGQQFVQTLEPRLYYVRIPFREQDDLPLFDTAEADFTFGQIFTENQFTGGDRVNDADQLTVAFTSRLLDIDTVEERLRGTLGQRFYFREQEVALNNSLRDSNRSDLLTAISGRLTGDWSVDSALQYDTNNNLWKKFSAAFRYQPERGKVMNIGYRYQDESLKNVDVSAQWPLGSRWTGLARWNYSLFEHEIVEGLAGLEYNADCWAVRAVAHKFATATQAATTTFFLQLEFTGLAGLGSNPLDVLRQSITGYAKTNEINRK